MKQYGAEKKPLFGPNKHVIQLADRLQFGLQLLVVLQPSCYLVLHFRPDTELPGDPAGVADRQYPNRMSSATGAFRTALFVAYGPMYQRPAQNLVGGREVGDQFIAPEESL